MKSWPSSSLIDRAGPLAPVAQRFVETRLGSAARSFQGGEAGLVALAGQVRSFGNGNESEEDEREFVEGAGALLALLLIDHVGDAAHAAQGEMHRVRLGRFGFFDPFHAITSALEAKSSRRELSLQIATAEAESRSEGPISRVVAQFVARLAAQRPDLSVRRQFECMLELSQADGDRRFEVDLGRAVRAARDLDETLVTSIVDRMMSLLPGATPGGVPFRESLDRLLPRLIRSDDACLRVGEHQVELATERVTAGLRVALLVQHEGRARYLRADEASALPEPQGQLLKRALHNLERRSQGARLVRHETPAGSFFGARTGDGLDSARVLLPRLYTELSGRVGQAVCIAIPHRDTYFACGAGCTDLVRQVADRTRHDAARAPHRLSTDLFLLTPRGLQPFSWT